MAWHALVQLHAYCRFRKLGSEHLCDSKAGALQQQPQLLTDTGGTSSENFGPGLVSMNVVELSFLISISMCDPLFHYRALAANGRVF